jgi:DUF4097 and DUF4098 domain-containing protein YvlB
MRTFDTPQPITVSIELGVGDVRIDASDRSDTTVDVRPSDPGKRGDVAAAEQTRVEYANGNLLVKGPTGWRQWVSSKSDSVDVEITLPSRSDVRVEAGVASVRSSGVLGEVRCKVVGDVSLASVGSVDLKNGAGDVAIDRAAGKLTVSTGSGAIRIGRVDGPAVVRNANGHTEIGEVSGEVRVRAANGDISIDVARQSVMAKTANGNVRLGEVGARAAVAQSAFGDLDVGVRDGVAAWLDLHTKFGRVRNDLDTSATPDPDQDTVEVHASTSYGDIVIHRSAVGGAS